MEGISQTEGGPEATGPTAGPAEKENEVHSSLTPRALLQLY